MLYSYKFLYCENFDGVIFMVCIFCMFFLKIIGSKFVDIFCNID